MDNESYKFGSPAAEWASEATKHALDELFNATYAYHSSNEFYELVQFVTRFRYYSPYNAFLIHIQRPGARYVAPPSRWERKYGRGVKPNANPIVILQPIGPVMFVFDVSDTEPGPDARLLPREIDRPFEVRYGSVGAELKMTMENAKRDGIRIHPHRAGSQRGGSIQTVDDRINTKIIYQYGKDRNGFPKRYEIPVRYELLLNQDLNPEAQYAIFVHELAHLYCGHLGTPNKKWWPNRYGLSHSAVEFEAESVSYLVCARLGIQTESEKYLSGYAKNNEHVPKISLECVMKAAGLIESMGQKRQKPREESNE